MAPNRTNSHYIVHHHILAVKKRKKDPVSLKNVVEAVKMTSIIKSLLRLLIFLLFCVTKWEYISVAVTDDFISSYKYQFT